MNKKTEKPVKKKGLPLDVVMLARANGIETSFPKRVAYLMKLTRGVEKDKAKLAEMT